MSELAWYPAALAVPVPPLGLIADTGTFRERALIYELNVWLPRLAAGTTAPDQGYPTIRNVEIRNLAP